MGDINVRSGEGAARAIDTRECRSVRRGEAQREPPENVGASSEICERGVKNRSEHSLSHAAPRKALDAHISVPHGGKRRRVVRGLLERPVSSEPDGQAGRAIQPYRSLS